MTAETGCTAPDPASARRHREVDGAALGLGARLVEFGPPRRDGRLGAQLERVDGRAEGAPVLGRARGQRLQRRRDLAGLPAHERDFLALEGGLVETREGRDARQQGVEFRITGGVSHGCGSGWMSRGPSAESANGPKTPEGASYAFTAFDASSAIFAKASASCTARSASTLRLISTPASLSPAMNRL